MKTRLLSFLLLAFSFANAQINVVEGFDSETPPAGWIYNIYQRSTNASSSGSASLRAQFATTAGASITTPNYVSNGMPIDLGFRARTLTPAVSHLNYIKYAINDGPWEDYINFSANNQNPWQLYNYPIIAAGVVPSGSTVKFQIVTYRTAASGLIDVYFDDITIQQGLSPMSAVAEYNFDNSYNNILGSNPFAANTGTSFTTDRNGNTNAALNLVSIGTNATIPNLPYGSSPRTISVWVKNYSYNSFVASACPFSYGTTSNTYELAIYETSFRLNPYSSINQAHYVDLTPLSITNSLNVWNHYVVSYDGTTSKIYKDGVLLSTLNVAIIPTSNNSDIFKLGLLNAFTSDYFDGAIDDLKIYNYALSQTEISNLYNYNSLANDDFTLNSNAIKIHPNPANDVVNFETNFDIKSIEFYNIQGQKVLTSNQKKIDVSNLTKGLYIVKIQNSNGVIISDKLIIE